MVQINKDEANFIRCKYPKLFIYRTTNNKFYVEENKLATKDLQMFRTKNVIYKS